TAVPAEKFPNAEAQDGYKTVTWTPAKETVVNEDQEFKASATKNTKAEEVTALGGLKPVDIAVWKGDAITWANGVAAKEEAKKDQIAALLAAATVTDKTDPARTSDAKGEFEGTLLVTFEDQSTLEVENQMLYVYESGDTKPTDKPVPSDAATVTFTRDEASIKDWGQVSPIIVKKGTAVPAEKFPNAEAQDGYKTVTWTPAKETVVNEDQEFKASATKQTIEETEDVIIPYLPTDPIPTKGSDDKPIPSDYITVTFKALPEGAGKVNVKDKSGETVLARVKPGTNLADYTTISYSANPGWTAPASWDPALKVVISNETFTATFTKNEKSTVPTVNPVGKDDENITGEGTKGSTITVVDDKGQPIEGKDGQPITTTVDDGGKWEIPVDKLPDDKKPTDVYVNQTEDGKDPSDPVKVPSKEQSAVPTVNPVGKDDENITGEGTKGSTITVVDDKGQPIEGKDGQPIATTVDDGGKWEIPVDKLPDDKKPTDVYVNQTEDGKDPSDPVKVEAKVDDNNSATPAINDVIEGDKVITGKGEPGADIVVTDDNGNIIGETKVNDDGTWSVIVPDGKEPKAGDVIRATQTEEGKTPTSATTVVKERYTPGEVDEPIIRGRDHKTPTYPVYTVVPGKTGQGSTVIDKLWYIFHIDEYDYQEVRNYKSTDHKMDVTPVIRNDRTMLPLRYVAEAIGADVNWDAKTRTATFTKDGLTAVIQIDSDEIVLSNGKTIKMDAKPLNINDRILVPVTNVANVFGLTNGNTLDGVDQDIEWDGEARTATIYIRR
ncbi:hypothetical protein HKO22_09890, partial [Peptoniphilus sp. AGMB00490]